jgi:hypothetical protein
MLATVGTLVSGQENLTRGVLLIRESAELTLRKRKSDILLNASRA